MRAFLISLFAQYLSFAVAVPVVDTHAHRRLSPRDGTGSVTGAGLAWYEPNLNAGTSGRANPSEYICMSGPASSWPDISTWMNFNDFFALATKYAFAHFDTPSEIADIKAAIISVSQASKVDARVILGVIIDESTGNLNVPCTANGVTNCGLMQSYNGTGYNPSDPSGSIRQMIQDGAQGTVYGPGLVSWFNSESDVNAATGGNVYEVLRGYNSGNIDYSNLSDGLVATPAYVSNVVNYMQGWDATGTGPNGCNWPAPGSPSPQTQSRAPAPGPTSVNTPSVSVAPPPTPTQTPPEVSPSVAGPSAAGGTGSCAPAPAPTQPGTAPNCCEWYVTKGGDYCDHIAGLYGISLAQFEAMNTFVDSACSNLWIGVAYCVSTGDSPGTPQSTSALAAASTSAPAPPGPSVAAVSTSTLDLTTLMTTTLQQTVQVTLPPASKTIIPCPEQSPGK